MLSLTYKLQGRTFIVSRVCSICGKGKMSGNLVSHSEIKTRKASAPNVQKVSVEINGKTQRAYVCTRCMKGSKADR